MLSRMLSAAIVCVVSLLLVINCGQFGHSIAIGSCSADECDEATEWMLNGSDVTRLVYGLPQANTGRTYLPIMGTRTATTFANTSLNTWEKCATQVVCGGAGYAAGDGRFYSQWYPNSTGTWISEVTYVRYFCANGAGIGVNGGSGPTSSWNEDRNADGVHQGGGTGKL